MEIDKAFAKVHSPEELQASIKIYPEELHRIPRTLYGHSLEHLGNCINGGIWAEGEGEGMFLGGVRGHLLEAMKSIHPAFIKYPGGCFADSYHWLDGTGPRDKRPMRRNRAWNRFPYLGRHVGPMEDNHFGTDEFIGLCREVGAEPQLTVNVGSGSAEEAAAWVEYCNGPSNSQWGGLRARNGHPDPYGVRYWFIGNEIFSRFEIGHMTPERYVKTFTTYARAMRSADPGIKLIGCGTMWPSASSNHANPFLMAAVGRRSDIHRTVLRGAGHEMDYLSIHLYGPSGFYTIRHHVMHQFFHRERSASREVYYHVVCSLPYMEQYVEQAVQDLRAYAPAGSRTAIAFDEWNLWYAFYTDVVQTNFNLRDGLWVSGMLNMFHRHAPDLPLANISQLVNCIGIISSGRRGTFLTPSGLAVMLYAGHAGDACLQSSMECPALPHESGLPVISLSATKTGRKLSLFLTNLHYDAPVHVECLLKGMAALTPGRSLEMWHRNPVMYNTFAEPHAVDIREKAEGVPMRGNRDGSIFEMVLPPHSLTCVKVPVRDL